MLHIKPTWRDWTLVVVYALLLAVVWFFAFACQLLSPVYIPAYIHFGFALACLLFCLPFVLVGKLRGTQATLLGMFLVVIVLMWFLPSSRQPFLRDLESVRVGMTVAEVEAIMGQ